jgi:hypothetical protein
VQRTLAIFLLIVMAIGCKPKGSPAIRDGLRQLESADAAERGKGFQALAALLNKESLSEKEVGPFGKELLAAYAKRHARLSAMQRPDPQVCESWVNDLEYAEMRDEAGVLLDLLGFVRSEDAERAIRQGATLTDAQLKYFAVRSLYRLGKPVDSEALSAVAANDEHRGKLFAVLATHGESYRMPAAARTQEALARSEMVRWLVYPTELGCAPREIELMKRIRDGGNDWFVYRFRSHKDNWEAGVAGPFAVAEEPTADANGGTFSDFQAAESATPEAHLERIAGILNRAHEARAAEKGK